MNSYNVTIIRTWEVEVEAESEQEAKDKAYDEITDYCGDGFDEVDVDLLEEDIDTETDKD